MKNLHLLIWLIFASFILYLADATQPALASVEPVAVDRAVASAVSSHTPASINNLNGVLKQQSSNVYQALSQEQPVDVVVLLDDSGSMATCWPWPSDRPPFAPPCGGPSPNLPSDPSELRYSAARLLLQLVDETDRVAVIRFDSTASGVGALGTLQPIGSDNNRRQLTTSMQAPTNYLVRGFTRIDLGLEVAINLLQQAREPGRNQYVVLLTDGEPSQQDLAIDQEGLIARQIATLNNDGVLIFPVVLCNPSAGCSGEFLREQFATFGVREATTASELLRVFSEILSEIKPNRFVLSNPNFAGQLQVTTRSPHAVQRLTFVTPSNGLASVLRNGEFVATRPIVDDPSVDVNVIDVASNMQGNWTVELSDDSGFAVIEADSYPQLINPPPSIADSPASPRYYPAGKQLLLMARNVGPSSEEPLLYNEETPLQPFGKEILGQEGALALLLNSVPTVVRLQIGNDERPLQLTRQFRVEARRDLPRLQMLSPQANNPLDTSGRLVVRAGFGNADVEPLSGTVYIFDESGLSDAEPTPFSRIPSVLVHQSTMNCTTQMCIDDAFVPADGHGYRVVTVVQGRANGVRFSDWEQTTFSLSPAVYIQGLPNELDLAQMPVDGWPVSIRAGTTEEIGELRASLVLGRLVEVETDGEPEGEPDGESADAGDVLIEEAPGVTLDFAIDVPEEGEAEARLLVEGLENLRPGNYIGEVRLTTSSPVGEPMAIDLRPTPVLPVTLHVPRPQATLSNAPIDFGDILFDTSPNFRLNEQVNLPIAFEGNSFPITISTIENSCDELSLVDQRSSTADSQLALRVSSLGPVNPKVCTGKITLSGPNEDYDVTPTELDWQVRVTSVEWSVIGSDINLGDLQDAGARVEATLRIRFSGKTPFIVQLEDLALQGSNASSVPVFDEEIDRQLGDSLNLSQTIGLIDSSIVDIPAIEVNTEPDDEGVYDVPITFIARQRIPNDPIRGTYYSGQVGLRILGLDTEPVILNMGFRSPTMLQRYVLPIVVPLYSFPLLFCTGPFTIFLLLVLMAQIRNRDFDEDEAEEVATAATVHSINSTFAETAAQAGETANDIGLPQANVGPPVSGSAWTSSEWGSVWSSGGQSGSQAGNAFGGDGAQSSGNQGDPWSSSW